MVQAARLRVQMGQHDISMALVWLLIRKPVRSGLAHLQMGLVPAESQNSITQFALNPDSCFFRFNAHQWFQDEISFVISTAETEARDTLPFWRHTNFTQRSGQCRLVFGIKAKHPLPLSHPTIRPLSPTTSLLNTPQPNISHVLEHHRYLLCCLCRDSLPEPINSLHPLPSATRTTRLIAVEQFHRQPQLPTMLPLRLEGQPLPRVPFQVNLC